MADEPFLERRQKRRMEYISVERDDPPYQVEIAVGTPYREIMQGMFREQLENRAIACRHNPEFIKMQEDAETMVTKTVNILDKIAVGQGLTEDEAQFLSKMQVVVQNVIEMCEKTIRHRRQSLSEPERMAKFRKIIQEDSDFIREHHESVDEWAVEQRMNETEVTPSEIGEVVESDTWVLLSNRGKIAFLGELKDALNIQKGRQP